MQTQDKSNTGEPVRAENYIVTDNRMSGRTETDRRGNFLAPDVSVRIAEIPQVDGGVRRIYAHTRREAAELRAWLREDPANVDGLTSSDIALIIERRA